MNNLGFGMMRLPLLSDDPTDFDYDQLDQMVDAFLNAGCTYFDTSFVYHNGHSEHAVRKALVERHPRESFTIATKFPTFQNVPEDKVEETFQTQLDNLGVDYIDYYLLHNIQTVLYDGINGKGGIIEAVKGGGLSKLPAEAEALLKAIRPDDSISSWSLRFSLQMEDVIAVLSGMSTMQQMEDNIATAKSSEPLSAEEIDALWQAMRLYRDSAPITPAQLKAFEGILWNEVPATAILQAYSICQIQPDPGFSDDNNYLKNALAERAHLDLFGDLPKQKVTLPDGTDATDQVEKAIQWLKENSF